MSSLTSEQSSKRKKISLSRDEGLGRLAILVLILTILYFAISDRIELSQASGERKTLIKQSKTLQDKIDSLEKNLSASQALSNELRELVEKENQLIIKLGGTPIPIPSAARFNQTNPGNTPSSSEPEPTPTPGITPTPSPEPGKPKPSPSPTAIIPLLDPACQVRHVPLVC